MIELSPEILTISMFGGLIIGLMLGHSLAFVLGGLGLIFGILVLGLDSLSMFLPRIYNVMDNYVLIAIPLFIFMAQMLGRSGVSDGLFDALRYLMGPVKGGIFIAVIIVSILFAACTGIVGASVVTMGVLAMPIFVRYGYDKALSAGVICAGGTLGIIIPPSIMLVVMASETGLSVGKLFAGSLVPGLLLGFLYLIYVIIRCQINPNLGPVLSKEERLSVSYFEIFMKVLKSLIPPMLLIMGVLGSIFFGIATPTEAAGLGAFLSVCIVIIYKRFSWNGLLDVGIQTTQTTSMVLMVSIGATCFTGVFISAGCGEVVSNLIQTVGMGNRYGSLIVMMVLIFILGMFLDWIGIVMITFPIFMPIVESLGFDKLWFVVICAVILQSSFLTPPFGYSLIYLEGCTPSYLNTARIWYGAIPFCFIILIGLLFCILFPGIVTYMAELLVK